MLTSRCEENVKEFLCTTTNKMASKGIVGPSGDAAMRIENQKKRLLNWLQETQRKRDDNNKMVFSRWLQAEKSDNAPKLTRPHVNNNDANSNTSDQKSYTVMANSTVVPTVVSNNISALPVLQHAHSCNPPCQTICTCNSTPKSVDNNGWIYCNPYPVYFNSQQSYNPPQQSCSCCYMPPVYALPVAVTRVGAHPMSANNVQQPISYQEIPMHHFIQNNNRSNSVSSSNLNFDLNEWNIALSPIGYSNDSSEYGYDGSCGKIIPDDCPPTTVHFVNHVNGDLLDNPPVQFKQQESIGRLP